MQVQVANNSSSNEKHTFTGIKCYAFYMYQIMRKKLIKIWICYDYKCHVARLQQSHFNFQSPLITLFYA